HARPKRGAAGVQSIEQATGCIRRQVEARRQYGCGRDCGRSETAARSDQVGLTASAAAQPREKQHTATYDKTMSQSGRKSGHRSLLLKWASKDRSARREMAPAEANQDKYRSRYGLLTVKGRSARYAKVH